MYTIQDGKRLYTLKKVVGSEVSKSAHPARFSPDDKYSRSVAVTYIAGRRSSKNLQSGILGTQADVRGYRHRVTLKKRYGLLLTQQSGLSILRS